MDIRELRIGSSVLYDGERMEVKAIDSEDEEICGLVGDRWTMADEEDLSPIPLTEELLKELGFEEEKPQGEGWNHGIEKVFSKEYDAPVECEDPCISMAQFEGGLYQLQVLGTIAYVRDLHTLQNFVFMTTKKELI